MVPLTALLTDILFLDYKENCYLVLETHILSFHLIFTSRLDLMQEASRLKSSQTHSRGQKPLTGRRQVRRDRSRRRELRAAILSSVRAGTWDWSSLQDCKTVTLARLALALLSTRSLVRLD